MLKVKAGYVVLTMTKILLLAGCGGGDKPIETLSQSESSVKALAVSQQTSASVISLTKISETRIGRTIYDYVFKINVQNDASAKTAITATVIQAGQGVIVLDGSVLVGDMSPRVTVTPADTITLRVDRAFLFNSSAIVWKITEPINGIAVPPEPNPSENKSTLAGVDSNANGIRDDVERGIAAQFGLNPEKYFLALQHAKTLQAAIASPSQAMSNTHISMVRCINDDQTLIDLKNTTMVMLDTPGRRSAYGHAFAGKVISSEGCIK